MRSSPSCCLEFLAPGGGYDEISTSQMSKYIAEGDVKEINFIDGDQTIEATLDSGTRSILIQVYNTTFVTADFAHGTALAFLLAALTALLGGGYALLLRRVTV